MFTLKVVLRVNTFKVGPGIDPVLVSPGTLAAVDVYVWLTYFQFSSVQALERVKWTKAVQD